MPRRAAPSVVYSDAYCRQKDSLFQLRFEAKKERQEPPLWYRKTKLAGYRAQFARQKVVGRPRAADCKLHIFKLFGGCVVAVLIFLDGSVINQVGDVDHHATGLHLLAANLGIE